MSDILTAQTSPVHERDDPLWLEIDALPHNGRYEYQITRDGGQLYFPGEDRVWTVPPNDKIPAVHPAMSWGEEGSPYRLGGQRWIMWAMLNYQVVVAPPARRVGKTTVLPQHQREAQGRKKGIYRRGTVSKNHTKAKELFEMVLTVNGGDPKKNPHSLVKDFHRADDQDRWIEFGPMVPAFKHPDGTIQYFDCGNEGAKWWFWSGTYPYFTEIQGFTFAYDQIDVDEMQLQHAALITEVVTPMLTDSGGRLYITGHPKRGMPGNALFQTYFDWACAGMAGNEEYAHIYGVQMPAEANPLPYWDNDDQVFKDRIPLLRQSRAQCLNKAEEIEEYDGGFVSESGGVFDNLENIFVLDPGEEPLWFQHFKAKDSPMPGAKAWFYEGDPEPTHKYALGVDWARKKNCTVINVMNRTTNHQACVVQIRGEDWDRQLQWVARFRDEYNRAIIHGDDNGVGDAMGNRLRVLYRSGYVGHNYNGWNKESYVRSGAVYFKEGLCKLIDVPEQRLEFRNFSVIPPKSDDGYGGKNQKQRFGHLPKEHDDMVDAFLMLVQSLAPGLVPAGKEKPKAHKPGTMGWLRQRRKRRARDAHRGATRIG